MTNFSSRLNLACFVGRIKETLVQGGSDDSRPLANYSRIFENNCAETNNHTPPTWRSWFGWEGREGVEIMCLRKNPPSLSLTLSRVGWVNFLAGVLHHTTPIPPSLPPHTHTPPHPKKTRFISDCGVYAETITFCETYEQVFLLRSDLDLARKVALI